MYSHVDYELRPFCYMYHFQCLLGLVFSDFLEEDLKLRKPVFLAKKVGSVCHP